MKLKLDLWVTPDGYNGTGSDPARRVTGTVEVTEYEDLVKILKNLEKGYGGKPQSPTYWRMLRRLRERFEYPEGKETE